MFMSTIEDVAKRAGVSKTTVSRFLNGKAVGNMKAQTVERIKQAIEELNYMPNSFARGLKNKESKAIGLIIPDITNPFFPEMVKGADDYLKQYGYSTFLVNAVDKDEQITSFEMLKSRNVDGIIIVNAEVPVEQIQESIHAETHIVIIESPNPHFDTVVADNVQGAYEAVKHLIDLGFRDIIHVSGRENSRAAEERKTGFVQCLLDHGIERHIIIPGKFSMRESYEITKKLIEEKKLPEAIFYASDNMAFGGIRAFTENNIRLPEDISIIGYDDIYVSSIITPGLTTIHQPIYEMGRSAGQLLLKKIKKEVEQDQKQHVLLKPHLVIRNSTRKNM